jgi:hypothetical protein
MVRTSIRILFLLMCILVLASACSSDKRPEKEVAFGEVVPVQGMNERIKLTPLVLTGPDKQVSEIDIDVENISVDAIWFEPDHGVRIWIYDEVKGKWTEVRNKIVFSGVGAVVEPKGKEPSRTLALIVPDLPQGNAPITIRVSVMGKVYRDGKITDEDVGGWVDVTLPP